MTNNSVLYIVSLYPGPRRHCPHGSPVDSFIQAHYEFLSMDHSNSNLEGVVFSISTDNLEEIPRIKNTILKVFRNFNKELYLISRPNTSASYGAWEDAIKKLNKDYRFSFLIEDDYVPTTPDIFNMFIAKHNPEVKYVASLCKDTFGKRHAAMASGLLDNGKARDTLKKTGGHLFNLSKGVDYSRSLVYNQVNFLDFIEGDLVDIIPEVRMEFLDAGRRINMYGNEGAPLVLRSLIR